MCSKLVTDLNYVKYNNNKNKNAALVIYIKDINTTLVFFHVKYSPDIADISIITLYINRSLCFS